MERGHFEFCKAWLDPERQKIKVWNIRDIQQVGVAAVALEATQTFEAIRDRCDKLLIDLGLF